MPAAATFVHWQHLPLPFWPAGEAREDGIYTGGAAVNGRGQPTYFRTANPRPGSGLRRTVGATVSDAEMIRWRKLAGNPVMRRGRHRDPEFAGEWDAPFLLPSRGARSWSSARWEIECRNFVGIGDHRVRLYSPDDTRTRYYPGRFDLESLTFTPETDGIVDHAYGLVDAPVRGSLGAGGVHRRRPQVRDPGHRTAACRRGGRGLRPSRTGRDRGMIVWALRSIR